MKRARDEESDDNAKKYQKMCEDEDEAQDIDDANEVDVQCRYKLHDAASNGHVDVAKVLIQNGADVNAVDEIKRTPLHTAAQKGLVDVAKVLIQNGADVNAVHNKKISPLHWAASKGHVDVAKVLIQNGADVNAVDKFKKTALHYAARSGQILEFMESQILVVPFIILLLYTVAFFPFFQTACFFLVSFFLLETHESNVNRFFSQSYLGAGNPSKCLREESICLKPLMGRIVETWLFRIEFQRK